MSPGRQLNNQVDDILDETSPPDELSSISTPIESSKYNLKDAVRLPLNENEDEWIAYNIYHFVKQICMLFGTVRESCTKDRCPKMTLGKKFECLWSHGKQEKESIKFGASNYIAHLLDWVQEQLDDDDKFPSSNPEKKFPCDYKDTCKTIVRRLLRVYAHIYHSHLDKVRELKVEAHMNTNLKHFIYFVQEFDLLTDSQLEPLKEYIDDFISLNDSDNK